ncbi:MAG: hypothetical protein JWN25_2638 [Verrucomicrobiales bacterium]|nr:hypothetical protein [Verrucomicrobiales bacterium]
MKQSLSRILLLVFCALFVLTVGSLGVPPDDLPLFGLLILIAAIGLMTAWNPSKKWRYIWVAALTISIFGSFLDLFAGKRMAGQHLKNERSQGRTTH